ncbi:MAG: OmpA family protein [Luteolibacter sp.]
MADRLTWSTTSAKSSYRLPGNQHLGRWAAVAMVLSILLHVIIYFTLDKLDFGLKVRDAGEITTEQVSIRPTESDPAPQEIQPPDDVIPPPPSSSTLMEEVDLLDKLPKDQELDIKPAADLPEYALKMQNPAASGDPQAVAMEVSSNDLDLNMPDLGRIETHLTPAAVGQVIVDPGSPQVDDSKLGKFTEDLIKKGANGKVANGTLDGLASLDELISLPPNTLLSKKTLLPSDLLFEFNSAEMRESAKVGLMKLALLIDRNPGLYCWIEGYTDLVGGDEFNRQLSQKRADAVKTYLVKSLRMPADKIITRGYGRANPIIPSGTKDEQAPNRRVEIRMRKTPPTTADAPKTTPPPSAPEPKPEPVPAKAKPVEETPPKPAIVEETQPEPAAPKAILVKPKRALPVEEIQQPDPPKAAPVQEETPIVPRAAPVILDEE